MWIECSFADSSDTFVMVIFVNKAELLDTILKARVLSTYQKRSAESALNIAMSLAKKTEGSDISADDINRLRHELQKYISNLQNCWNKCGRRATKLRNKYPDLTNGNIEVPTDDIPYTQRSSGSESSAGPVTV